MQEIIRLAYLVNKKGPKQVWVSFAGHVNSVDIRIAKFDDVIAKFVEEELCTTVYLTAGEIDTDDNIIRQLTYVIEKLYEKLDMSIDYCENCKTHGGCRCDEMYEAARDQGNA